MELSLIKSLLNKQFYIEKKGKTYPDNFFTKDLRKIKNVIDKAIDKYDRDLTLDEVRSLFLM